MKIPEYVRQALKISGLSMVQLSEAVDVHRNWLIELRDGGVPTTREGRGLAGGDPRYQKFGRWLEEHGIVKESEFIRVAEMEQNSARTPRQAGVEGLNTVVENRLARIGPDDAVQAGFIWSMVMGEVRAHGAQEADRQLLLQARRLHQRAPERRPPPEVRYGYLWAPENGWTDDKVVERQVRGIVDAVHAADVAIEPEVRSQIVRALTRLQYLPAAVLSALVREHVEATPEKN